MDDETHVDASTLVYICERDLKFGDGRWPAAHLIVCLDYAQGRDGLTYQRTHETDRDTCPKYKFFFSYVQPPPKNCENMSKGLAYLCWPPSWAFRPSSP